MKRALFVFCNIKTHVGEGLNFKIAESEQNRLAQVVEETKAKFGHLGLVTCAGEYPTYALAVMQFLASKLPDHEGECLPFVGLSDFLVKTSVGLTPDTLIVSCLSFYQADHRGHQFFEEFAKWWDNTCHIYRFPKIPPHPRKGDESVLLIDYHSRQVTWLDELGEPK